MGSDYQHLMTDRHHDHPPASGATAVLLLALGIGLSLGLAGCAGMSDGIALNAFADPAKYDMYDCKQLQDTRKGLALRAAELQGLMAKADTGVAGPIVAEVAYRNDYISTRASSKLADEVWQRNNCVEVPDKTAAAPTSAPKPVVAKRSHRRSASPPVTGGE
jgi:hypothetical protein